MRLYATTIALLSLPLAANAIDSIPYSGRIGVYLAQFQDWFYRGASGFGNIGGVPIVTQPDSDGVVKLTLDNWRSVLVHSGKRNQYNPPEAWMLYFTGISSCFLGCNKSDSAWAVRSINPL